MHVTGDINLDDTSLDQLYVAGISTLVGYSTFRDYVFIQDGLQVAGAGVTATTINVSGVSTFTGSIDANGALDVDGHTELDDVNVSGASTFASSVDINALTDISETLNVGGAVSFRGPSVGVAVTLAGAGGITTTGGDLYARIVTGKQM